MEFSQPELIQILRRRLGLNQSELGAQAFNTSLESGRTKVKNIELGKQIPTYSDLKKLAAVLGVRVTELMPDQTDKTTVLSGTRAEQGLVLHPRMEGLFPGLGDYLSVLNKAVVLDDDELVAYTCRKIADLMSSRSERSTTDAASNI